MFVGQRHHHLVDELEQTWSAILREDPVAARLVTLVRHQGVGKSQIVREFYYRLAARQSRPAYWPEEFQTSARSTSRDPMPGRKVLGPPVADFVWWDFESDLNASGSASPAVLAGEQKLKAHLPAVWEAYLRRTGRWERVKRRLPGQFRDLQPISRWNNSDGCWARSGW